METTVNERITSIISFYGYKSKRAFADKIGIAQTSLNDVLKGAEPKYSTLYKILLAEPLISAEWLMRGTGDMELPSASSGVISSMDELEELEDMDKLEELNYSLRVLMTALEDVHQLVEMQKDKITALETELEGYKKAKAS